MSRFAVTAHHNGLRIVGRICRTPSRNRLLSWSRIRYNSCIRCLYLLFRTRTSLLMLLVRIKKSNHTKSLVLNRWFSAARRAKQWKCSSTGWTPTTCQRVSTKPSNSNNLIKNSNSCAKEASKSTTHNSQFSKPNSNKNRRHSLSRCQRRPSNALNQSIHSQRRTKRERRSKLTTSSTCSHTQRRLCSHHPLKMTRATLWWSSSSHLQLQTTRNRLFCVLLRNDSRSTRLQRRRLSHARTAASTICKRSLLCLKYRGWILRLHCMGKWRWHLKRRNHQCLLINSKLRRALTKVGGKLLPIKQRRIRHLRSKRVAQDTKPWNLRLAQG